MVGLQVFLLGLLIVSTISGLATEAVKSILTEFGKSYRANSLAGIVSLAVSLIFGVGYILINNIGFTTQAIIYLVALILMSWLCAMVGYDKVVQAISQFKTNGRGDE